MILSKVLPLGALLFLAACASPAPRPLAPAAELPATSGDGCPLGVKGAKVTMQAIEKGAVVTFTAATPATLDELRLRVKNTSEQHGKGAHRGVGHNGTHGTGEGHGMHFSDFPPVHTDFEVVDGGARLHVLAVSEGDVRVVRERLNERLPQLQTGKCD
jgi:hypothetical protein